MNDSSTNRGKMLKNIINRIKKIGQHINITFQSYHKHKRKQQDEISIWNWIFLKKELKKRQIKFGP